MIIAKFESSGVSYINYDTDENPFGLSSGILAEAIKEAAWEKVREKRDTLLRDSDYAVMPDYPLTDAQLAEVKTYRQALRDIPETAADPDAVDWPTKPEFLTQ